MKRVPWPLGAENRRPFFMPYERAPLTTYNRGYLDGAKWAVNVILKLLAERGHDELVKMVKERFVGTRTIDE
jgi:hypothetical protein